MSVLIKGMKMPSSCSRCNLRVMAIGLDFQCAISGETVDDYYFSRHQKCPIVKVPTPHGRLIDADALMECRLEPNHYEELKDGYIPDYDLDSAPTIIEAEVSDNA